jgi:hypothetical protein
MDEREGRDAVTGEPQKAPPARATDPQKPGQPLRPGPQGETGPAGPAGGVDPARNDPHAGDAAGNPDDRGRGEGDRGGL